MYFKSVRRHFSHTTVIEASPEEIFPLLCPVRCYEWIEDWNALLINSKSGYAEEGCVFKTFDPDNGEDTWLIAQYMFPNYIKFIRFNNLRTINYTVAITTDSDGLSLISWEQDITALNDEGNEFVADLEKQDFVEMTDTLGLLLEEYLIYFEVKLKKAGLE